MKNPEFNDIDLEYRLLLEEVAFLRSHIVQETESRIGDFHLNCRIMMELSGNQIRTGKIADKPAVTRLRPQPGSKGKDVVLVLLVPDCPESQGIAN